MENTMPGRHGTVSDYGSSQTEHKFL